MALPTQIVSVAEAAAYMSVGSTIPDSDRGLVAMLIPMVENAVRSFVGHNITQPSSDYVEYYPQYERDTHDEYAFLAVTDNKVYYDTGTPSGHLLYLNNLFVRSISEIREDASAYFGQGTDDFADSSVLTAGTDYFLQLDSAGMSKSGVVHRINRSWSAQPGTIMVTYMAGLTTDELDTTYADIKFAVLEELVLKFKVAKSRAGADGTGVGIIQSEKIANAYSVQYEVNSLQAVVSAGLSEPIKERLEPYRRLPL